MSWSNNIFTKQDLSEKKLTTVELGQKIATRMETGYCATARCRTD